MAFWFVCLFGFVPMTSLLPFYLCLIWQWVILVNFIAYGLIEFSTKCTSLFGQSLHNQASTYAYFNCYCYRDPGIKGSVCACWGSFPRVGFHFMSMLYISFHDSCWCWMKLLWFVLTHQLGVHVRGIHLHLLHPLYGEVSNTAEIFVPNLPFMWDYVSQESSAW